jgi:tRNA A37 threonylcarbamoyladenosine modification protein TsaB
VIDARRREVFVAGPRAIPPDELELAPGTLCVGSGAVRYRATLERLGADVPPDHDERHVPRARLHAALAGEYTSVDAIEPIYARVPDAELPRA